MNFFENELQVECIVQNCPAYVHTHYSPYLLITVFFPHYLTFGLFAMSLYRQELYVLLMSFMLMINYPINVLLQHAIKDPPRFPLCYNDFGSPSFATQHLILFDVIIMTYPYFFGKLTGFKGIIILRLSTMFTLFAWIYVGANDIVELFWGAFFGLILAIMFQIMIHLLIKPNVSWILSWSFCSYLSIVDTFLLLPSSSSSSMERRRRVN